MGRFGSLFRKSDEKEKAEPTSNPYAQQPSTDTYTQSNSYSAAQNRQVPSGLPSGPRTGLPSGPRPGSSAPPPYTQSPSLYSKDSPTFPADSKRQDSGYQTGSPAFSNYQQSPNLPSGGYSPAFSNYQQSPNLPSGGSSPAVGYGNDRFGAQGGYGSNRYDNTAAYGQNNYNAAPSQKIPGGYGGLGGGDNELFSGYNPRPQHQDASFTRPDNYDDLTETEKGDVDADEKKAEIVNTLRDTAASSGRSRQMIIEGKQRLLAMNEGLYRDGEILNKVEQQIEESDHQSRIATANLKNLDAANSSLWNFAANTKGKRAEHEKMKIASDYQRQLAKQEGRDQQQQAMAQWQAGIQQKPQPTLGRPKTDHSRFTFEDDDGEQEKINQEIDENLGVIESELSDFHRIAKMQHAMLEQQNAQTARIAEKTDKARDGVVRNKNHIQINYLAK